MNRFVAFLDDLDADLADGSVSPQTVFGPAPRFEITGVQLLPGNRVQLTWNSRPRQSYIVLWSVDGSDFRADAGDNFASGGETTTTVIGSADAPIGAAATLLFKVSENAVPGGG